MIEAIVIAVIPILIMWLVVIYCVSIGDSKPKFPMK